MNRKRGLFRVYLVLALLFVPWATDKVLRADNIRNRESLLDSCSAIRSMTLSRELPGGSPEEGRALHERLSARAEADWHACWQRAIDATPVWGDMIAKYPRDSVSRFADPATFGHEQVMRAPAH